MSQSHVMAVLFGQPVYLGAKLPWGLMTIFESICELSVFCCRALSMRGGLAHQKIMYVCIQLFYELRSGCEKNYSRMCNGTIRCVLQRRLTARYVFNGGTTKYAVSENMELIDWILIIVLCSLK